MNPLGVGEVVDLAVNIWVRNWRTLLAVSAAVIVPLTAVIIALDLYGLQEVIAPDSQLYLLGNGETRFLDESRFQTLQTIGVIFLLVGYQVATGANLKAAGDAYLGDGVNDREALAFGLRRVHSLIWIAVIYSILVVIGLIFFVIPGIWLLISLSLSSAVLVFEGVKGRHAINRSFNLVSDNWWRTLGALLIGLILAGVLFFLVPRGVDALADNIKNVYVWVALKEIGRAIVVLVTAPFYAALLTVIYYDLRVRKEGFDVQYLAQGLGTGPVAPPPAQPPTAPPPGYPPPAAPQQPGYPPPQAPQQPGYPPPQVPQQPGYAPPPPAPEQPAPPPSPYEQQQPPPPSAPPPSQPPPGA